MLMVTNRGRNKILRDVDRTRLEVKNNHDKINLIPNADPHAFPQTFP